MIFFALFCLWLKVYCKKNCLNKTRELTSKTKNWCFYVIFRNLEGFERTTVARLKPEYSNYFNLFKIHNDKNSIKTPQLPLHNLTASFQHFFFPDKKLNASHHPPEIFITVLFVLRFSCFFPITSSNKKREDRSVWNEEKGKTNYSEKHIKLHTSRT